MAIVASFKLGMAVVCNDGSVEIYMYDGKRPAATAQWDAENERLIRVSQSLAVGELDHEDIIEAFEAEIINEIRIGES